MRKALTILVAVLLLSSPAMAAQMILSSVEAPGAPSGYTSFDLFADVDTNLGFMELRVNTPSPGDIYQNATAPDDPDELFASYVTIGYPAAGEQSANTSIWGGAVDLGGGTAVTFNTQYIDIAWSPAGGVFTGAGTFQVARITIKDTSLYSYQLMGWQTGGWDPVVFNDSRGMFGDVDSSGDVGGSDLSVIISNWGKSGQVRGNGDLNGDGTIEGNDYSEVLSNWGNTAPEPPAIPEPATLGLLLIGGLAILRRRLVRRSPKGEDGSR